MHRLLDSLAKSISLIEILFKLVLLILIIEGLFASDIQVTVLAQSEGQVCSRAVLLMHNYHQDVTISS